jgi:hypothetical protein
MQSKTERVSHESPTEVSSADDSSNLRDEERGLLRTQPVARVPSTGESSTQVDDATELQERVPSSGSYVKRKTSQLLEALSIHSHSEETISISPHLAELVEAYAHSEVAEAIRKDADSAAATARNTPDVTRETIVLRGRKRASWLTQFRILSGRAFKNLYRNPTLLAFQYTASIAFACKLLLRIGPLFVLIKLVLCGLFFHHVSDDIGGFQNRLGVFFFTLALFGFACLSSLDLFARERILFMRER